MNINLISDTITKPSPGMRRAMAEAIVGDDVFGQDPTVNKLQDMVAEMFGKEAALFCPSGTMTNQIAICAHTNPLDEVICEINSHVYQYETGGYAYNARVAVSLLHGTYGKITAKQIDSHIKDVYDWLPLSKLVVIENSTNRGGGNFYSMDEIAAISTLCREKNLLLHLDGARLFNVLVETGDTPKEIGQHFDSISICLSKGLGAPVGSLIIGNTDFIFKARRLRKVMGGGMRQAGILASAGIYALKNNIDRLKDDNRRAAQIGQALSECSYVKSVNPVKTNIVIFTLADDLPSSKYVEILEENGIIAHPFGRDKVRFVTHLDFTEEMLQQTIKILKKIDWPAN